LVGALTTLGALTLLSGIGAVSAIWLWRDLSEPTPVAEGTLLHLDVGRDIADGPGDPLDRLIAGQRLSPLAAAHAIGRAASDPRIAGLIAELGGADLSLADAQSLAAAVGKLRAAGKLTLAHADSFADGPRGAQAYLLASAFERVWMQPSGTIDLTGLRIDVPHVAGLLDLIGIEVQVFRRHEFKSALDGFARVDMAPEVRANLAQLLADMQAQILDAAAARGADPSRLAERAALAPFDPDQAVALKLIDRTGYRDQLLPLARQTLGGGNPMVGLRDWAKRDRPRPTDDEGSIIALIGIEGPILRGGDGLIGRAVAADAVARKIERAARDRRVRAILLAIDSPGGSYPASDTLWRAVKAARAAGKPVVALIGGTAASGGYFVAMAADAIVSSPGSVTGSIGVVTAHASAARLLDRLGVRVDSVASGPNAGGASPTEPLAPARRAEIERSLDRIYADFTQRVAADRQLPAAEVERVARGRVLTGLAARDAKLIDGVGGLEEALARLHQLASIEGRWLPLVPWAGDDEPFAWLEDLLDQFGASAATRMPNLVDRMSMAASVLERGRSLVEPMWLVVRAP
jgi:protease-4